MTAAILTLSLEALGSFDSTDSLVAFAEWAEGALEAEKNLCPHGLEVEACRVCAN